MKAVDCIGQIARLMDEQMIPYDKRSIGVDEKFYDKLVWELESVAIIKDHNPEITSLRVWGIKIVKN